MVSAVTLVAITLKFPSITTQSAIGLALLNLMTFSEFLVLLINSWIKLETSLGAIARLKTFLADTPFEDTLGRGGLKLPSQWPQSGSIEFRNVSARYR